MLDEELVVRAVEALRIAGALILQDAFELAVHRLPADADARLEMISGITAAGRDVEALGKACAVLVSRRDQKALD